MEWKKQTFVLAICAVFLVAMSGMASADSANGNPVATIPGKETGVSPVSGEETAVRAISYDHWSVLNVVETITDLGDGTWHYSYQFTNTDTSGIWHFGVYLRSTILTGSSTLFSQTPTWYTDDGLPIDDVYPVYDARNLDPSIVMLKTTWAPDWQYTSNPIPVGAYVSGYSFIADVYDPSPKYYFYEFVGSYAVETGYVTAVGLTDSEPEEPTIYIETDEYEYVPGDTMICYLEIDNPTANPVMFNWYLGVPQLSLWFTVASTPIPAEFSYSDDVPLLVVGDWGPWPFGIVLYVELTDLGTGRVLDNDAATCAYWSNVRVSRTSDAIDAIEKSIREAEP